MGNRTSRTIVTMNKYVKNLPEHLFQPPEDHWGEIGYRGVSEDDPVFFFDEKEDLDLKKGTLIFGLIYSINEESDLKFEDYNGVPYKFCIPFSAFDPKTNTFDLTKIEE